METNIFERITVALESIAESLVGINSALYTESCIGLAESLEYDMKEIKESMSNN